MTQAEFYAWVEFNKIHPITDNRRIYLPAALVASGNGFNAEAVEKAMQALSPDPKKRVRPLKPVEVVRQKKA